MTKEKIKNENEIRDQSETSTTTQNSKQIKKIGKLTVRTSVHGHAANQNKYTKPKAKPYAEYGADEMNYECVGCL
jgi:hypothetical protein